MEPSMKKLLACLLVAVTSGCPDVKVDENETGGPIVEFDPAKSLATGARFLPFPNDLVRDPMTGKLNLGPQACESAAAKATRETILNQLDGFGTYEAAVQITFTKEVDEASLMGNVALYQITNGATKIDPANAVSVPITIRKGTTLRQLPDACATPETVNTIAIIPLIPLQQKSSYVAVLLKGIKDTDGTEFGASSTWGLVSAKQDPVTVENGVIVSDRTPLDPADPAQREQLFSLDLLWKAHAEALAFVDAVPSARPRTDILVATKFTTQTVTDPLDPSVSGSPAASLPTGGFLVQPIDAATLLPARFGANAQAICDANAETNPVQCFLKLGLGGCDPTGVGCGTVAVNNPFFAKGAAACAQLYGCASVGNAFATRIVNTSFQKPLPNPFDTTHPLQGPWTDPVHPESQGGVDLDALIGIPTGTMPAGGWPVIVYGHGLTLSKDTALTFAGKATAAGFAIVAIDFVAHGSRAVRISNDPTLGCTGRCVDATTITAQNPAGDFYATPMLCEKASDCPGAGDTCGKASVLTGAAANEGAAPTPTSAGQCYDQFLSTDLAKTRDGLRQTVLDLQRTILALKACAPGAPTTANCGSLVIDPTKILYAGVSLGGILGSITTAESPDVKAAMLSVPGAGWVDLLENTDTVEFRCPLVNGLIDAGILSGTKWTGANSDALCLQDKAAWQGQPGYGTFAATARWILDPADPANFASKLATKRFMIQEVIGDTVVPNVTTERLAALTGVAAKAAMADAATPPSVSTAVTTPTVTENKFIRYMSDAANKYVHSSLIRPADATQAGVFGFIRMQVDARTWLEGNK
jgi:hypothetical protein